MIQVISDNSSNPDLDHPKRTRLQLIQLKRKTDYTTFATSNFIWPEQQMQKLGKLVNNKFEAHV